MPGGPASPYAHGHADVLRDEGEAYARLLDEAGVDVPSTDTALRQAAADLAHHLR